MSLMLTRMFAYFTLVCCLLVASITVRFSLSETIAINLSTGYLDVISDVSLTKASHDLVVDVPSMEFKKIEIPPEEVIFQKVPRVAKKSKIVLPEVELSAANELPFYDPFTLSPIKIENELPINMLALFHDFNFQESKVAVAEEVSDEVSMVMAASDELEPEFFEYPIEEKKVEDQEKVAEQKPDEAIQQETKHPYSEVPLIVETESQDSRTIEYSDELNTQTAEVAKTAVNSKAEEEVAISGLVAFDYSQANQDVRTQTIPSVSKVTTQNDGPNREARPAPKPAPPRNDEDERGGEKDNGREDKKGDEKDKDRDEEKENDKENRSASYSTSLIVSALGSDLKKLENLQGFEIRFQDDLSEAMEDYGSGEIRLDAELSQSKMTRSVTILKRGFIPTSTEIILEEGTGKVAVPLIDSDTFNKLQYPYERKGTIGSLLVELDDETDVAKVDVPYGDVVKLDGDLKQTDSEDYRYQLFVGIQAGNALLSYHRMNGEQVKKIVHIHEHEVTFDSNYYEQVVDEKIRIYEEDLLARENSPLIISGEQVRVFASERTAKKMNNHTYKFNFGSTHLGGRRYIELNHQSEPLFVGIRDNNRVTVPSENFMRFILSKVEGAKLGNRCLVQVNLNKKADNVEVGSESVSASLMTYTQMLDSDGKFYDSLSSKTRKIIIIGESHGSSSVVPDAKINLKIQYQDGSIQYLNSYCSPNTYLVEQL